MEGVPFRLMLTLLLGVVILGLVFHQLTVFTEFSSQKQLADSISNVLSTTESMRSTSSEGSFKKVNVVIPEGSFIGFNNVTENIDTIVYGAGMLVNSSSDLLWNRTYGPGTYSLTLFYGAADIDPAKRPNLVPFK